MDFMRVILIVLGLVLVVGIYLADRYKRRRKEALYNEAPDEYGVDAEGPPLPSFQTSDDELPDEWVGKAVTLTPRRHEALADEQLDCLKGMGARLDDEAAQAALVDEPPVAVTQKAVDVPLPDDPESVPDQTVMQATEEVIVLTVLAGEGRAFRGPLLLKVLREIGFEHGDMNIFHFHHDGSSPALFSVANILEPGYFDLDEMVALETPGVAIFMQLPAVIEGEQALAVLLQKTRQMAAQLSGTLCDEQRCPLSDSAIEALQARAHSYPALA